MIHHKKDRMKQPSNFHSAYLWNKVRQNYSADHFHSPLKLANLQVLLRKVRQLPQSYWKLVGLYQRLDQLPLLRFQEMLNLAASLFSVLSRIILKVFIIFLSSIYLSVIPLIRHISVLINIPNILRLYSVF